MATWTAAGSFMLNGIGINGAAVDAWKASRFTSVPGVNAAPPSGSADVTGVTTAVTFGSNGAFQIALPTAEQYYIRVQYGGVSYWQLYDVVLFQDASLSMGTGAYVGRFTPTAQGTSTSADRGRIDLRDYNVDATGATDCTSAVQAAMTDAQNRGYELWAPPGAVYKVSAILSAWNGARWNFNGSYLDIQTDHTSTGRYVNLNNLSDVQLRGVRVKQTNASGRNGVQGLFSIFSGGDILLEDCWGVGGEGTGLFTATPAVTTAAGVSTFRFVRFKSINNYADGIHVSRGASDGWLIDPYCSGNGDDNISINSILTDDGTHNYNQITRVHVVNPILRAQDSGKAGYSINSSGIAIYGGLDCKVMGGTATGSPYAGLKVATTPAGNGSGTPTASRCDANGLSAIANKEGIVFTTCTDITAENCTGAANTDSGAMLLTATRCIIRGGKYTANAGLGLFSNGAGASNNVIAVDLHGATANTGGASGGTLTDTTFTSCITT